MNRWYKADSIRIKANGYCGICRVFGRYAAEVREDSIRVIEANDASEPSEKYGCIVANGVECWGYPTVAAAYEAGENYMRLAGWTEDYEEARTAAVELAKARHELHKAKSTNYARRYAD
jgi:hypothetical protein